MKTLSYLLSKDFCIITAENPEAKQLTYKQNLKLNKELEKRIRKYNYHKVVGFYGGNKEHSYLIEDIKEDDAIELAREFNQESVLIKRGLMFLKGNLIPHNGKIEETPKKDYSVLNLGNKKVKFSYGLNW